MDLIIVESPSKAKTISKYLKGKYKVDASAGHIRDLPVHSLGVDIKNDFQPRYVNSEGKEDLIRRLQDETKKADRVYLATDPDREGEAISWHLQTVLGLDEKAKNRIEFNEVSQKAVEKALTQPRTINYNLVDAQQARRVLDRLVGYKLSTLLNHKIENDGGGKTLSGGRVQSVALRLIVEREREIEAFVPKEYWNISALLSDKEKKHAPFKAALDKKNGKKYKPASKEETDGVLAALKAGVFTVAAMKKSVVKSHAPAPFTTSSMQQEASNKLGLTAPETMSLAQHLYEGIGTENGDHIAFITYMRTDSVRISSDAQQSALAYIRTAYGDAYAPEKPNFYSTKKDAQDAHEAVRPIDVSMTPEKAKTLLDKKHYSLYKLIYERFLASQMAEAKYDSTQMEIDNSGYTFKASGKIMLFPGYTAVYRETEAKKDDDEAESAELLPDLKQGEEVLCEKITTEQKFTKPPLRYTDASLVKAMEEKGIGRPSTYATIIAKLNQKYVKKEGKYMKPVPVSYAVSDMLVKCFPDVMDVGFTADMETKLDKIEEGGQRWQKVIADFYPDFEKNLKNASTYGDEVTDIKCEKCGRPMIRRTGKYGKYLACSGYPECHNIVSESEQEISAVPCPKCGENMVVKTGKFGKFLACPNYPDCKTTLPYPEENGSPKFYGICPECGSPMAQKKTKKGKIFYGCSAYPDCKFLSWDIPTGKKCPKCGSAIVQTARGYIRCSNKDCDYKEGKANTNGGNGGGENAAPKKTYTPLQSEDFDAP
ncbi:MAG: type I DNA topoisomerase, partial [Candidatus Borkfalkiaceae bacterium]|nr:type I DNA topoisomerase [Christensenellaceae bacterium]